jgi:uncharacterized membrane protein
MLHFIGFVIIADTLLLIGSYFGIRIVKSKSRELIENERFKEYSQEAEIAMSDILYLPLEYESDAEEDEIN